MNEQLSSLTAVACFRPDGEGRLGHEHQPVGEVPSRSFLLRRKEAAVACNGRFRGSVAVGEFAHGEATGGAVIKEGALVAFVSRAQLIICGWLADACADETDDAFAGQSAK